MKQEKRKSSDGFEGVFDGGHGEQFIRLFGEDQAARLLDAAISHNNDVHNRTGDDLFTWALAICIGYECLTKYRKHHGITVDAEQVQAWCCSEDVLRNHMGDVDYLALFAGAYEGWF